MQPSPVSAVSPAIERERRHCPSCGADPAAMPHVKYEDPDWPLRECTECGLVFLEYVPVYSALYQELAWTQRRESETQKRLKKHPLFTKFDLATRWRLRLGQDATPHGGLKAWALRGPVLDVGCGLGRSFSQLPAEFIPYGVEIDAGAAAECAKTFEARGGKVINADAISGMAQLPEKFFTGASLWSYLEHEARPKEALIALRRVLRDDAIVLIKVPDYGCWNRKVLGERWPGFRHPDHVQYFTHKTLRRLVTGCGYSVTFRLYGRIPVNDNLYAILRPA